MYGLRNVLSTVLREWNFIHWKPLHWVTTHNRFIYQLLYTTIIIMYNIIPSTSIKDVTHILLAACSVVTSVCTQCTDLARLMILCQPGASHY